MNIYVFGNPDLPSDSVPLKLLPKLKERFSGINFIVQDPNELGIPEESEWWVLDTVRGLKEARIVTTDELKKAKARLTMHDFDLATHILLVKKVKKDADIKIIGIPDKIGYKKALSDVFKILSSQVQGNAPHSSCTDHKRG